MSQDTTTDGIGLNLPGIGIVTDWATQYRQNFEQIDDIMQGYEEVPGFATARIEGQVTNSGTAFIENFQGQNLNIDDLGNLNAEESTGTSEVLAQTRRRYNTPVGGGN